MKMCNSVKYIVDNKARQYEHNIEELDRARVFNRQKINPTTMVN
jgi:hypothetical protein